MRLRYISPHDKKSDIVVILPIQFRFDFLAHNMDIFISTVQVGPSGRGLAYVDIKFKVPSQDKLLIMKRNSEFEVNIS